MTFDFYRFRFRFVARQNLRFPPGQSGNILRGAFGTIFRNLACVPECPGAATCERRRDCAYARVFEPRASCGEGPSGLADWPRPFVFRASHLDGATVPAGGRFDFGLHLFDLREPSLPYFARAFGELAREGLGPGRGRADLEAVEGLSLAGDILSRGETASMPVSLDLNAAAGARRVRVRFLTPTELKAGQRIAQQPDFAALFGRLRDRISTLRTLYGPGPLEIDFQGMGRRAEDVVLVRSDLRRLESVRRSSRTGQIHALGGVVGEAEYQGELAEFLPYLEAGKWTGVGRHTVWGQGEVAVEVLVR